MPLVSSAQAAGSRLELGVLGSEHVLVCECRDAAEASLLRAIIDRTRAGRACRALLARLDGGRARVEAGELAAGRDLRSKAEADRMAKRWGRSGDRCLPS
jgi:hypothetical protein